jgi:tRNA dimethylallyltransferase
LGLSKPTRIGQVVSSWAVAVLWLNSIFVNNSNNKADVICLMGATAVGKTALAVELCQCFPFQIVNVDSAQIYKGMDIGTGKPDAETLSLAPHRLLDIRDPAEYYSVADFRSDVLTEIEDIVQAGSTPLLVGGTMLYFKVLRDGLADMPHANKVIREEIDAIAKTGGWQRVHDLLAEVDPDSANRIHPNDPQRLQRALEVYRISGKTMTQLHAEESSQPDTGLNIPFNLHFLALQPENRQQLHKKIRERFLQMIEDGLVDEVSSLRSRGDLDLHLPSMKSVGYRQVWQHLEGDLSFDGMVEKSIIATRQLAKRQFTWLRSWENLHNLVAPLSNSSAKPCELVLNYLDSTTI